MKTVIYNRKTEKMKISYANYINKNNINATKSSSLFYAICIMILR